MKAKTAKNKKGAGRPFTLTKAQTLAAIAGSSGIIANVCRRAKVTRVCAIAAIERYAPETTKAMNDARNAFIDMAEQQLTKQVKKSEQWAVKFTLATLGKKRGYTERVEHTGADGEPLSVEVEIVKK